MRPSLAHRVQYLLFRGLERAVASRSWEQRLALGARFGRLWHVVDGRHRSVARSNVRLAFPEWSPAQTSSVVRANFEHLGANAAEFFGLSRETPESILARYDFEGLEHLEAARARGKGVLLLSGHLGNWEVGAFAVSALGYPAQGVARTIKNPLLDDHIRRFRGRSGARIIPHRDAVRPILRALREGACVALLMDQRALAREGVRSTFFDHPVSTNQGLAVLALKTGAPVVPLFDERLEGGRHRVRLEPEVEPPVGGGRPEQVAAFTRSFDAVVERAVRRCPEQWFWMHRRWRIPGSWSA